MRGSLPHKRDDDALDEQNHISTSRSSNEATQSLLRGEFDIEENVLPGHHKSKNRTGFCGFLQGPDPPRPSVIRPLYPHLQRAPLRLLDAHGPRHVIFGAVLLLWLLFFILFLYSQSAVKDGNGEYVINLDCTDTFWKRKNECGLNGIDCRPFTNQNFAFRCPAKCASVQLLNPRVVGPTEYNYRPLVIGTQTYRGDSFICGSAIHAGVISDQSGGCGRVTLTGEHKDFVSSEQNGVQSIPFNSHFPLSFTVEKDASLQCSADMRSVLLPVSLLTTTMLAVFSTSPLTFFPIFVLIFAHVSFASDPPTASSRNITVVPDHVSMFAKRILPAMFIAVVLYITTIKRTLAGLTAQLEKALFWLGGFWIGALSNYTFDWIPISRLTAHDLEQQPGAKVALAIIILILFTIVVGQMFSFWREGRLPRYLSLYGLFIGSIILCLMVPGVNLRIHHYILALLFLPGTSLQTRPSLFYQGILLGLFVNGIARWDFDSVLQTSDALRADARLESITPAIFSPTVSETANGLSATFNYGELPAGMVGISTLVNDVERDRAFSTGQNGIERPFNWKGPAGRDMDEYFRFAYIKMGRTLDYSAPGTLFKNGSWLSGQHDAKLQSLGVKFPAR